MWWLDEKKRFLSTSEEQRASWSGGNTLSSQESQRPGQVTIGDIVSLMQIIIAQHNIEMILEPSDQVTIDDIESMISANQHPQHNIIS